MTWWNSKIKIFSFITTVFVSLSSVELEAKLLDLSFYFTIHSGDILPVLETERRLVSIRNPAIIFTTSVFLSFNFFFIDAPLESEPVDDFALIKVDDDLPKTSVDNASVELVPVVKSISVAMGGAYNICALLKQRILHISLRLLLKFKDIWLLAIVSSEVMKMTTNSERQSRDDLSLRDLEVEVRFLLQVSELLSSSLGSLDDQKITDISEISINVGDPFISSEVDFLELMIIIGPIATDSFSLDLITVLQVLDIKPMHKLIVVEDSHRCNSVLSLSIL
mmetsp:Transcript_25575/g.25371  ORF Transcript_25575/g.25371 Transcript_25575/m.25371 type:complete len:279 (-) Transcript_25575:596-1432(-)